MNSLKETLLQIEYNNYVVPNGMTIDGIITEMLNRIGAIDSELRDNLIYGTFHHWVNHKMLNAEQVKQMLYTALDDEHLFYGLGKDDEDAVFTRTFSILLVPLALEYDESFSFLSPQDFEYVYSKVCLYFRLEKDLRGYIAGKGWAHSVAHTADAFDSLVASSYCTERHCIEILELMKNKFCNPYYTFINNEDDRAAEAIVRMVQRGFLNEDYLSSWAKQFIVFGEADSYPEKGIIRTNLKNLLRGIYFKLGLLSFPYNNNYSSVKTLLRHHG